MPVLLNPEGVIVGTIVATATENPDGTALFIVRGNTAATTDAPAKHSYDANLWTGMSTDTTTVAAHDCDDSPCPHEPLLKIHYIHVDCPENIDDSDTAPRWSDEWSSACDSECTGCGQDIEASSWHLASETCKLCRLESPKKLHE